MGAKRTVPEKVSGRYTPIPHAVLDGKAFTGSSYRAKAMLFELLRQHSGDNNGHLHMSVSWLKRRGWTSTDGIQAAKRELMERHLIIRTKLGGLNAGPDLYALTWLPISKFYGLDIASRDYAQGAWRFAEELPASKKRHGRTPKKQEKHSASRNSTVPPHGIVEPPTVPPHGTKMAILGTSTVPSHGNNETLPVPIMKSGKRIVGKKGRSGGAFP